MKCQAPVILPRICVPCRDGYRVITRADICYIESHDIFCKIYSVPPKVFNTAPMRITDIEKDLHPEIFCRIHRAYIVSLDHVLEFNKTKTRVLVTGGAWLPVGRVYQLRLLNRYKFWKM